MKSLSDLLKSHKVPGIREAEVRRACAEVLTRVLGVTVLPKQVRYTDGTLYLTVQPLLKSALTLKFDEAKEMLQREGITVTAIR